MQRGGYLGCGVLIGQQAVAGAVLVLRMRQVDVCVGGGMLCVYPQSEMLNAYQERASV